jgi:hypothetical protein
MEEANQPQDIANESTEIEDISWTASEYISHEKNIMWHIYLFTIAILLVVIVYLVSKDVLAAIVIIISALAVSVYATKKPTEKTYSLSSTGLRIGNSSFEYSLFRSFSIVEEGAVDSIWLKPLKRTSPITVIYFSKDYEEKIEKILSSFLPYEVRELDLIDRVTKRIRF